MASTTHYEDEMTTEDEELERRPNKIQSLLADGMLIGGFS